MDRVPHPLLLLLLLASSGACSIPHRQSLPPELIPPTTRQVLMVTTDDWAATKGWLQRWERGSGGRWRSVAAPLRVSVGRSGLGFGLGLHRDAEGPQKTEGDGRAPAGLFRLGTAFGYAAAAPEGVRLRYRAADARDYFVDDVSSDDYNRWRRIPAGSSNTPEARWRSFERMRRQDHVYELGVVIEHNDACVPGRGSAIFLHVWVDEGVATSGCTAMARRDLLELMRWLDPAAEPLLLQLPLAEMPRIRRAGDPRSSRP